MTDKKKVTAKSKNVAHTYPTVSMTESKAPKSNMKKLKKKKKPAFPKKLSTLQQPDPTVILETQILS